MAKVPAISRLAVEDFPDQKTWIAKLLSPLNNFLTATVFALTAHLTFSDNFLGQEQLLDFTYQGTQSLPVAFLITMGTTPQALYVVQALENVNTPVSIAVAWNVNQKNQVQVTDATKFVSGVASALTVGNRYQIRVRVTP